MVAASRVGLTLGVLALSILVLPTPALAALPALEHEQAKPPDTSRVNAGKIVFTGQILLSDPTRTAFGPDPLLWSESCHHLELRGGGVAYLALKDGATTGELEDLDLYLYDADGDLLLSANTASNGIGNHHTVAVPPGATEAAICLAGGARALYEMTYS